MSQVEIAMLKTWLTVTAVEVAAIGGWLYYLFG